MRTVGQLFRDRKKDEYRTDDIDIELHAIEWPFDVVVEGLPYDYDAERFREHFATAYGRERGLELHEVEPAYRFGYDLRKNLSEREWSAVELTARAIWGRSNPLTWERAEAAIGYAWQRAKG